jgi:hypothetical protein
MSDGQLRESGLFGKEDFRLKWWEEERYGVDIEPEEDA